MFTFFLSDTEEDVHGIQLTGISSSEMVLQEHVFPHGLMGNLKWRESVLHAT
jgi:hypothetical protein